MARWRKKPTKEVLVEVDRLMKEAEKEGGKFIGIYWTFGRYDMVTIAEGPDEKAAMKVLLKFTDVVSTETLVALPA